MLSALISPGSGNEKKRVIIMDGLEMKGLLQRDRLVVFSGLAAVTTISWAYMFHMVWRMSGTGMDLSQPCLMDWGPWDLAHMFIMWAIMMVAMMFPAATPMILMLPALTGSEVKAGIP